MENDMIEKRLAGLVLEQYADVRFRGNPTEVAYQFCRAVHTIAAALDSVGVRGIDYARMAQPSAGGRGSGLPDAEYAAHVRRMADLERLAHAALDGVPDHKLYVWTELRMPLTRAVGPNWRPASTREAAQKYQIAYGTRVSHTTVANWAKEIDRKLDKVLKASDWTL